MNTIWRRATVIGLALALMVSVISFADAPEGFTSLFNGKDLTGWKGDSRLWSVKDGVIVGNTENVKLSHNSFLMTEKKYSDFVLRVKVKLRNHNSGVQFRSEALDDYAAKGYQADVAEATYFGMLYEEQGRGILPYWNALSDQERADIFNASKKGEWNEYEITCNGDHVKMVLNGKVTLDFDDPEGAKEGIIGLQLHAGPGMQVEFKDIYIKDLAPKKDEKK
ncbi:MAG: DUF1080 domain-containing protein [Candidatus Hydrogenedentes bacterium]|nr:DUF1080 domain-containing protein [Candidatus Hydrogenedentota bacterium]